MFLARFASQPPNLQRSQSSIFFYKISAPTTLEKVVPAAQPRRLDEDARLRLPEKEVEYIGLEMVLGVVRATARKAANAISHGGYHGPGHSTVPRLAGRTQARHASTVVPPPLKTSRISRQKLFSQTRNLWAQIFNQLTAPGLRVPTYLHNSGNGAARSLHSGNTTTIRSGLSFHARTALSSGPRHQIYLPRPPSRGVPVSTNVGLGVARNFSTARPIFQNLVDNVPVVGRAFYEADLDLRKGYNKHPRSRRGKKPVVPGQTQEMMRPRDAVAIPVQLVSQEDTELDLAHYFDNDVPSVTTYLLVPLTPTSSRGPLSDEPILPMDSPPGLLPPLSYLAPYHAAHNSHATRVARIFRRLDLANVWHNGASYSPYGRCSQGGAGICTELVVEFSGWTAAEVRAVIGETGTGWCALEEHTRDDSDSISEFSSFTSPEPAPVQNSEQTDVSSSFIMPVLDVSASLGSALPPSPYSGSLPLPNSYFLSRPITPMTDIISEFDDPWRDDELEVWDRDSASADGLSDTASDQSWQRLGALEFSAQHLDRWN